MALTVHGRPVFSTVQSTWNVLETSAGPALAEAHDAGLRVLVKEALANGRLAVEPPAELLGIAEGAGVGADAVALAAALAQPWADTVLLGAASPAQLRANLAAARVTLPGPNTLAHLAVEPGRYWGLSGRTGLELTGRARGVDRRLLPSGDSLRRIPEGATRCVARTWSSAFWC